MALTRVRFNEGSTGTIEGDITDDAGAAVPGSSLAAATLTLYDLETAILAVSPAIGILNSRHSQDVKGAHNVTIDSAGHFVWQVQSDDNVIVTSRRQIERHRALLAFTWATGFVQMEFEIEVLNLRGAA